MKKLFASVKGKVLVGVLAIGVVGAGAASASNFGFIDQLQNILNGTTDNVATASAGAVKATDNANLDYGTKITNEVNAAAGTIKRELTSDATSKIKNGNDSLDSHFNEISMDLEYVKNNTISSGKEKISQKVNEKVAAEKARVENAAVAAINANLNLETTFSGTTTVNR